MKAEVVSADLLRGARPKRLVRRQGRWYLEVVRFASKGDGVFQPKIHRVEGHTAILDVMRRGSDGPALAASTERMLADAVPDGVFELSPAGWVPARSASSTSGEVELGSRRSPTEAALAAEVVVLRATVEALMARVARLERKVAYELPLDRLPTARSGAHTIDAFVRPSLPAQSTPFRDGANVARSDEAPAVAARAHVADATPATVQASAPAAPVTAPPTPLRLPPVIVLVNVLKDLAGQEIPLKEQRGAAADWTSSPERYYAAWLVDDTDAEVGGLLCDAEAVARLGGALLMLPRSEIDEQASGAAPSDDAKMAASEICNNLTGPINDVPSNPHVRARMLSPLTDRVPEWLASARTRLVCAHPGGGRLVLVAR